MHTLLTRVTEIELANSCARAVVTSAPLSSLIAAGLRTLLRMFSYHFMQNALLAGTIVALVAGAVGYFMVLRGESFAGHSLANIGFAGAAGAALLGAPVVVGLMSFGALGALGMGALRDRVSQSRARNDVAVGAILALALGLGVLFERLSSAKAASIYAILFGSPLGVADADLRALALTAAVTVLVIALIARPLLFASLDPVVAAARGAPVRLLSYGFLLLLALAVAQATQVVGALLIFALLVAPAATAQRLSARVGRGVALSVGVALLITWSSLVAAYLSSFPVGFFITTFALGGYLAARLAQMAAGSVSRARAQTRRSQHPPTRLAANLQAQEAHR
jgi:zinc/manganese transport system permease protein